MKRPRTSAEAASTDAPLAKVTVQFVHLPPDSRAKLDDAIRGWADWHLDKYLPGYVAPQTVSGSLSYEPETMHLAWEDRPEAPAQGAADTLWFNVKYEQAGGVPQYDRLTDDQLRYSHRKKRPADALLVPGQAPAAAGGGGGDAGKPAKRLRGSARCFNCGSYGHSMRECWKELNRELVEERKREQAAANGGAAYRSGPPRYFLEGATGGGGRGGGGGGGRGGKRLEQVEGEFEGLQPGLLSPELRQVLGIGPTAPPPWLRRMRELGPPPGYMVPLAAAPPIGQQARTQRQDVSAALAAAAVKEPASRDTAAAAAAGAVGDAAEEEGSLEDFIPLGEEEGSTSPAANVPPPAAPPAAPEATRRTSSTPAAPAAGAVVVPPLEDFIALDGGNDSPESSAGGEDGGADAAAAAVQLECCVAFPGVNVPAPEAAGIDPAWTAVLAPAPLPLVPGKPPPLVPPGFASPLNTASAGRQAAGRAGQHSMQVQQPWERRFGDSSGGVGGWDGRVPPMQPLHMHTSLNGGTLAAAAAAPPLPPSYPDPQQQRFTPPQSHAGRAPTPDLYQQQQQQQPPPPPPPQQQQTGGGWHTSLISLPAQAAAQNHWLPSESSQQRGHSGYQPQQAYQEHQLQAALYRRQEHQQQQVGGVYSISRSDPGHMLVYDQHAAPPQAAFLHQQQQVQQQMQQQQMQYWAEQELQQSAQHLQQQQQQPAAYGQPPLPAQEPGLARGWDGGAVRFEYEQKLWMGDGR